MVNESTSSGLDILAYEINPETDLLLIKRPSDQDDEKFRENLEYFAAYLRETGLRCTVFGVEDLEDLMVLTIADMNSIDWFHRSQILMLKEDMPEFDQAGEEEE